MRPDGKPFRWNMSNPGLLRRLKPGETQELPEYQQDRLLRCGANIVRAGDFDFVFVGRSLESLYDVFSGALARTTWYDRLQLLQMSVRKCESVDSIRDAIQKLNARFTRLKLPDADTRIDSITNYLRFCQLTPARILQRQRGVAFVDVVDKGTTFGTLLDLLKSCCDEATSWKEVLKRLHWVAVLPDPTTTDAPTWKPSASPWTRHIRPTQITEVIMNADLWFYLADEQFKTTYSYPPILWGENTEPPTKTWDIFAARGSRELYRYGEKSRRRIAALLDEPPEPIDAIKELARELRREESYW